MNYADNLISQSARRVSEWTRLGVKLPKDLNKAIEVYEALVYVETGYRPVFDLGSVTPQNAEAVVREFAEEIASTIPVTSEDGQSLSILEQAKQWAVRDAAREIHNAAGAAVPDVIGQLTPRFDEHARVYVDAVAKLPVEITSDSLLDAGPDAVKAYEAAKAAAAALGDISWWIAETRHLPGHTRDAEPVLRILRPKDALQLSKLDTAHSTAGSKSQALRAIDPVLYAAATNSIEFGINTLPEAAEIRDRCSFTVANVAFK